MNIGDSVLYNSGGQFCGQNWHKGKIVRLIYRQNDKPLYVIDIGSFECKIATAEELSV